VHLLKRFNSLPLCSKSPSKRSKADDIRVALNIAGFLRRRSPWRARQGTDYSKIEISPRDRAEPYLLSGSAGLYPAHQDAAGGRIGVLAARRHPDG